MPHNTRPSRSNPDGYIGKVVQYIRSIQDNHHNPECLSRQAHQHHYLRSKLTYFAGRAKEAALKDMSECIEVAVNCTSDEARRHVTRKYRLAENRLKDMDQLLQWAATDSPELVSRKPSLM